MTTDTIDDQPAKSFIPAKATWTKADIVSEVVESTLEECGITLAPAQVTDEEAQRYVDAYWEWLIHSLSCSEDTALYNESAFQIDWLRSLAVFAGQTLEFK